MSARIAAELSISAKNVAAVIQLLEEGATIPFIARYRKEATGNLDEVQIRTIGERRTYLADLEERRASILSTIESQGKLTAELRARIEKADTKAELEDLYLPYKPKRRTRAAIAREKGLEPLAERILSQAKSGDPKKEAAAFVDPNKGVADVEEALKGARDIVAEVIAENADIRALLRRAFAEEGLFSSSVVSSKKNERTKFEQYYDHHESIRQIPSHRFLAILRGEEEGVLKTRLEIERAKYLPRIEKSTRFDARSPFARELVLSIADSLDRLLEPSVSTDVLAEVKERSDRAAVDIFAANLRNLLLASPLGEKRVIGVDPGVRTGCKLAATDDTGKFLENTTIYLHQEDNAKNTLLAFVKKHKPAAIGVGNGTGGREAESFIKKALSTAGLAEVLIVSVNEAGASVYSASDIARDEFPDLDLTVRGAISIARRLQDPLAELVKIDPKSIGVGQYQHDVNQPMLAHKLEEVVESCVNHVGVEVNTASAALLSHVAGIGPSLAKKIVKHREKKGAFKSRKDLSEVSGLGPKAFEQAAGFLRVRGGAHPLDASAVHPERYKLVEKIAGDLGAPLKSLLGDATLVAKIEPKSYVGEGIGEPTLKDIISELKKPGRDPRDVFEPPKFRDDVSELEHLSVGMELEGIVTNVTAFGAFVDVGVHQDGLVHVSQLADRFVRDPNEVVKAGDKIRVRVLEIDLPRRRIALTARSARR